MQNNSNMICKGVIILIAMVFVSSCAVPEMQLQHNPKSQTNTYSKVGTIEVLEFEKNFLPKDPFFFE